MVLDLNLSGIQTIKTLYPAEQSAFQSIPIRRTLAPIAILLDIDYPDGLKIGNKYFQGLRAIIKNGRYHTIIERYFGKGNIPSDWFIELERYQQLYHNGS